MFGSNPCRVRHGTQELVFFRDDTEKCMRRQCLMPPPGASRRLCSGSSALSDAGHAWSAAPHFRPHACCIDAELALTEARLIGDFLPLQGTAHRRRLSGSCR